MTQMKPATTQRAPDRTAYQPEARPARTGWVGWVVFGATMLILMGAFQFIEGLVAVLRSGYYVVTSSQLVVNVNFTTWGWVHMAIGALAVITGFGLFVAQTWARVVGVILAGISAIVSMAFIPAYPFWSLAVIALDVIVIYALVAHGREIASD